MQIEQRRILVTGGSTGIGRAVVGRFLDAGAMVKVAALPGPDMDSLGEMGGRGQVERLGGDLSDPAFVKEVGIWAGEIDIFVHSAGLARLAPFLEANLQDWRLMYEVNFLAGLTIAQVLARSMAARKRGKIILISSAMADWVNVSAMGYAATKHAISAARKGLRLELASYGIQTTEVRPGLVGDTAINTRHRNPSVVADLKSRPYVPIAADDIARAVMFVAEVGPGVDIPLIEVKPVGQQ
ncbi:SDR family oxidoreductase [Sinorhizobium fredii]|uniref:SDR family oxidoreductase n=1 Tax=Rhizobium fredii TaxID=380 RepID=UPI0005956828|nr:SDR family NAD(P)-dependent oxidoreductase [Sinorhizobium fredii]WOS65491.1 SDR family NAD(P)-dependent oxidoreductase [Sinorhizobium fredii GR64]